MRLWTGLKSQLKDGALPSKALIDYAKKDGISERTLKRAKAELGIGSKRTSEGQWLWYMEGYEEQATMPASEPVSKGKNLGTLGILEENPINTGTNATVPSVPNENVGTVAGSLSLFDKNSSVPRMPNNLSRGEA